MFSRSTMLMAAIVAPAIAAATPSFAQDGGEVSIMHYFTGALGLEVLQEIFNEFQEKSGVAIKESPIGHEDFKSGILVRAAGHNLPDVFSYWAGARTQFVIDHDSLRPIDDMWAANGLDNVIAKSVADGATVYNGKHYLVPFNYHYAGMFYNTKVMADAGITEMPKTWDEFLAMCETLNSKGVTPIALGSKNRWPAQFWFDYLVLRTAGTEYRAKLMDGSASYNDPEVQKAMGLWKELVDKGYFVANANADDWTDAGDKVARGDAAMTLMGTWITGYWNGIDLKPEADYNFFEFPQITEGLPNAVVGPVDGFVISANAANPEGAEKFLNFVVSDTDIQTKWASSRGALSANTGIDPSIYTPVMQKAAKAVADADAFVFNYDLSTPPPVAEVGLSMFSRFMDDPSKVDAILDQAAEDAKKAFTE
ncbi:MAG: extracellular solute-binding protein [Hoeflea sp.]|uniref:ABC transporter substrate-binding protein n=1 Tax=Hoeflea sp. TaxID=1940281 RepID=UPI00272F49FE|nr:extracellular solute-binding protein [Hoeflea sp.]MDP2119730.1 extracellular solute-binding protein [Hoeflea sp.]MDP3525051.1 extracellular solute-binding protein [Hoeflea sp.]MDZ7603363.1 extracellular solute-binding protein [Hoeflea sp.]